jgi:nucleotide-binding universal stress UspA family protein
MYQKIIVPLDGSKTAEQILPYARLFARAYDIPVELLRVEEPAARPAFWPPQPTSAYLPEVSGRYFSAPLRADRVEESGKPAEVIVDRAKANPDCVIAMTTHGLSNVRRWLLGSVASKVVQSAVNPLLLLRALDEAPPEVALKSIVVPLDGSGLAERIFPHVVSVAKKMKLAVELVRVYDPSVTAYPVLDMPYLESLERYREEMRHEAETYLDGKSHELRAEGVTRVSATVIQGDPASEIIGLARKTPENLIAMSTHGRSGIGRWLLGSVAEKIVQHSRDPVLLVRSQ